MVEIRVMAMKAVTNIQEDKMVDVVVAIEWILDMTAVQSMEVDVGNLQEVSTETAVPAIGGPVAAIGEPVPMKVVIVTVDIPKINI
jgi:hypothetical protein